jgi:hypothetical protein
MLAAAGTTKGRHLTMPAQPTILGAAGSSQQGFPLRVPERWQPIRDFYCARRFSPVNRSMLSPSSVVHVPTTRAITMRKSSRIVRSAKRSQTFHHTAHHPHRVRRPSLPMRQGPGPKVPGYDAKITRDKSCVNIHFRMTVSVGNRDDQSRTFVARYIRNS